MYKINREMVAKVVAGLAMNGRLFDASGAMSIGTMLIAEGHTFPSASEAAGYVSTRLWNSGLVS